MRPRPQRFHVGYVTRARGLRGELGVRTFDPSSETLLGVSRVLLIFENGDERAMDIQSVRPGPKELLVQFAGIATREDAERLAGAGIYVAREQLKEPSQGEFFQADLLGLCAVTEDGRMLGTIEELFDVGPVPNLVVRKDGQEWLIPFADEFVPDVDLEGGRVIVRVPEYTE